VDQRTALNFACAGFVLALAFTFTPRQADAQTSKNAAGAEALYEQARGLMKQEDFEHACPKFKQSYDLDAGGGTLLNLAECYEKQGKFASAWSSFKEALVIAQRDNRPERVEYARKHIAAVEPKVSKITIEVPSDVNEPGLSVSLDGAPLGDAAWGVGMPVDPGAHQITASAPNKQSYEQAVQVENGSTTIKIPKLEASASGAAPPPVAVDQDVVKKPVTDESVSSKSQRTVGFVIGGVGVVALGVGSYFGLHAMSKWSDRKDNCTNGCTETAKKAGDDAKSAALISDIGFGVGIIAAGVGTYLVLSAKPSVESRSESTGAHARPARQARSLQVLPAFGPLGGGLVLRGNY
jgi:hypothetical protein